MQCLNDLDELLHNVGYIRKRDANFAADFEIKFRKTRAVIADTLRGLTAERDTLAAEVRELRAQLATAQDTIAQLQQDAEELSGRYA